MSKTKKNSALALSWVFATCLPSVLYAQTYTTMAVTASFNNYSYSQNMTRVWGNVWQGDFFLYLPTNRFVFTSGVNTWWGETNQTEFVPPMSGFAETNPTPMLNGMIIISNQPLTWYRFRFNADTLEYAIFPISNTTLKVPPIMTVAGSFNNWQASIPNMEPISYNVWQGDFLVTAPTGHFKFTINNWQLQYGETNQPSRNLPISGIAEVVGNWQGDIYFSNAVPGFYRITFRGDTLEYSMRLLYSLASEINLARNPSFETAGTTGSRAYYWEWGVPDTNAGYWGSASRESWRSHSGSFIGTLRGSWSGFDYGGFWQHSSALPGRTYRLSGWFWSDPNWSCVFPELKIEFFDSSLRLLDYENIIISSTNTFWTRNTVTARAPTNAAGVRIVIAVSGAGYAGALQFDDLELRAVSERTLDFEPWPLVTNDMYIENDWILSWGRVASNRLGQAQVSGGLLFSEYVEGSGFNKAVEIFNGTTNAINLSAGQYYVQVYANGATNPSGNIALTGTVAAGGTYIICHSSATQTIKDVAQIITGSLNFNGDDAFVLRAGGTSGPIIDRFGRIGEQTNWSRVCENYTLRRKPTVYWGDTNAYAPFDPLAEWVVYPIDTFDGLGQHAFGSTESTYTPVGRGGILAPNLSNYLQSAELAGGIGSLTFWCRTESTAPPVSYLVQTSPDGVSWSNITSFTVSSTEWDFKSLYIYQPAHSYVRLLHVAGSNRLYIDEIEVAEPVGIMRIQDFSLWTSPAFTNEGLHELNEWELGQGYVSTNRAYADLSAWLNPTGGYVLSPLFTEGSGEVTFRHRRATGDNAPILLVQTSPDLTNWTTRGTVVSTSTSTYQQASVYMYVPTPSYVRILCTTNESTTAVVTAYALVDEIMVSLPRLYRSQNFDTWPTKNTYVGASQYQGWLVSNAMVHSENAFEGQAARLSETVTSGFNAYIMTPELPDGVGAISFWYRKWSESETSPTYQIQTSTNGTAWVVRASLTLTNGTNYQLYELYLSDPTARYVRIYHSSGAGRALFDQISVDIPQPPATYVLNGWHEPTAPWTSDSVHLWLTAVDRYGARDLAVTSYYRIGTSGAFTAIAMVQTNTYFYRTVTPIAPQPTGTIVQYYFRADFQGPGSASTSPMFFPAGGSNSPAWYGIPRNKPGQVWINELSYAPIDFWSSWGMDTNEFIELCGPTGYNLSGWTIVLVYGDQFTGTNLTLNSYAHYRIPNGTILANVTNGYGFFVLGDSNWGPGIVDMIFTNYTKYDTNGVVQDNMADGHPDGLILLNEIGGIEYQLCYEGYMPAFRRITASQDYFDTNSLSLIGTGSNYEDFVWTNGVGATPGKPNSGQTLVPREEPPPPPSPPAQINVVRMVWTTNIVIYTSGNTTGTPWNVIPYYTTNLMTPLHNWLPLTPYNSVYEGGGTNRFWFSPNTNRPVEAYYFRAVPP